MFPAFMLDSLLAHLLVWACSSCRQHVQHQPLSVNAFHAQVPLCPLARRDMATPALLAGIFNTAVEEGGIPMLFSWQKKDMMSPGNLAQHHLQVIPRLTAQYE